MTDRVGPTARAAAGIIVVALGLAACATPSRGLTGDNAAKDEVLLRMDVSGGFVPLEWNLAHVPSWTLYGDGRVVTEGPTTMEYPGKALPNLLVRTITQNGIDAILRAAREAGLSGPDKTYTTMTVADAATTTFEVGGDDPHTTSVYALDFEEGATEEERQARARLQEFAANLSDLGSWLPEGSVGSESSFEPTKLRVHVRDYQPNEELPQQAIAWPLEGSLARFGVEGDHSRCGALDGADAEAVLDAARDANQLTPWTSDGKRYALVLRPLLPDESGC